MWKENDEYEAAAPAVQAHFHALRAEDALRREDFAAAEREGRLASDKFALAAEHVSSQRTTDALLLLAENYEYRAKVARARLPAAVTANERDSSREELSTQADADDRERVGGSRSGNSAVVDPVATKRTDASAQSASRSLPRESVSPSSASNDSSSAHDPAASAAAETQLNLAAAEMEELWRRLQEIGLSSTGASDKNNVLMASRHLSSSLGDSFCLLPAKTKTSSGVQGTAVDGGSTLRAAVASRMRNQRLRLMEQQYSARGILDDRFHKPPVRAASVSSAGSSSSSSLYPGGAGAMHSGDHKTSFDRRATIDGGASALHPSAAEVESLHETIAHQKLEIVRLLNTVKSLSSENTTLLKKCETLANVQSENREIHESMEKFKVHYNQKLVMIKRALEEWRRQRNSASSSSTAPPPAAAQTERDRRNAELEQKLALQQQQLAQLTDAVKSRDEQLAKYEKWYRTLKAGAKAKQRSQAGAAGSSAAAASGMNGSGIDGFNAAPVPKDSFTSSSSFHGYSSSSSSRSGAASTSASGALESDGGRPPAHPTRRAL